MFVISMLFRVFSVILGQLAHFWMYRVLSFNIFYVCSQKKKKKTCPTEQGLQLLIIKILSGNNRGQK